MKNVIAAGLGATLLLAGMGTAAAAGNASGKAASNANSGAMSSITQNYAGDTHYSGGFTQRNVPAMGTIIATPTAPCMGSYGGQAAVAGFGIGLAGTMVNHTCNELEIVRTTWNIGEHRAAEMMMCQFKPYRTSQALMGHPCPAYYYPNHKMPKARTAARTDPPAPKPAARNAAGRPMRQAANRPMAHRPADHQPAASAKPQAVAARVTPPWMRKMCQEHPVKPSDKPYIDYYCHKGA